MESVAILGAGAWGTALAIHLARARTAPEIRLWTRDATLVESLIATRQNARYLPAARIQASIAITADLGAAIEKAALIVVATPVSALLEIVATARRAVSPPLFWLCKGFVASDTAAGVALAHQVVAPRWPAPVGVVSGPCFAEEVARGLPTAVAVSATDARTAEQVAQCLRGEAFRAYVSDDLTGVEVGGAVKNVLAIAAGASDGLNFGHNARAALITRGLAETGRLSAALGGRRETLMGLAGLGDLVLTCTGDLSRNRRVGLALAEARPLARILADLGHVAEGVAAARDIRALCGHFHVDMPICSAVYRVLYEHLPPRRAVEELLGREPGPEFH